MRKIFVLLSLTIVSSTIWGINDNLLGVNNEIVGRSQTVMSLQELKEYFSQVSAARWEVCEHILDSVSGKESGESSEDDLHNRIKQMCFSSIPFNDQDSNKDLSIASYNLIKSLFYKIMLSENLDVLDLLINYKNKKSISTDKLDAICQQFKYDPFKSIANFIKIGSNGYPLHKACKKNYKNIVEWLVELGADVNGRGIFTCRTPLFAACKTGNKSIVEYLLGHDAEVNVKDYKKETPLFVACRNGHIKIVEFLLGHGADINKKNNSSETPLFVACENGHEKIVKLLIAYGANINVKSAYEETPLIVAHRNGYENIVEIIGKYGTTRNRWWSTPAGLWSLESSQCASGNMLRSRAYSAFNRDESYIEEKSHNINKDVFLRELPKAYTREEINDSSEVKLLPNSNCKKFSRRKKTGKKSSRHAVTTENKNVGNQSEKKASEQKSKNDQQHESKAQGLINSQEQYKKMARKVKESQKRRYLQKVCARFLGESIAKFIADKAFVFFKRWV